jgi:hypothetical protein
MIADPARPTPAERAAGRCLRAVLVVYGLFLVVRGAPSVIAGFFEPTAASTGLGIAFVLLGRRLAVLPFRHGRPSTSAAECYLGAALAMLGATRVAHGADPLRVALVDWVAGTPDLTGQDVAEPAYRVAESLPEVLVGVILFWWARAIAAYSWRDRRHSATPFPTG